MAIFLQLFAISVDHTYFADGGCRGLGFFAAGGSAHLMEKAGLLVKRTANGIRVFYDSDRTGALRQLTADPDEPFRLAFKVFSQNPDFLYYTDPSPFREDAVLYFDSRRVAAESGQGSVRLHGGEYVSEVDFEPLGSPLLADILDRREMLIRPNFVVSITVPAPSDASPDLPPFPFSGDCRIAFRTREMYWKYYLLGEMRRKNAHIVDRNNGIEFAFAGEEPLSDGRTAMTFISRQRIPVRERSDCCFQLREKGAGGGKILIKRLPVATPSHYFREVIDGRESPVSDIYVNC